MILWGKSFDISFDCSQPFSNSTQLISARLFFLFCNFIIFLFIKYIYSSTWKIFLFEAFFNIFLFLPSCCFRISYSQLSIFFHFIWILFTFVYSLVLIGFTHRCVVKLEFIFNTDQALTWLTMSKILLLNQKVRLNTHIMELNERRNERKNQLWSWMLRPIL